MFIHHKDDKGYPPMTSLGHIHPNRPWRCAGALLLSSTLATSEASRSRCKANLSWPRSMPQRSEDEGGPRKKRLRRNRGAASEEAEPLGKI